MHRRGLAIGALVLATLFVATACSSSSSSTPAGGSTSSEPPTNVVGKSSTTMSAENFFFTPATLGGREFRLGQLHPSGEAGVTGTVLLYDGVGRWNSWGIVLARSDADLTDARVMLVGPNGASKELPPLRFSAGEASSWLVTHEALTGYDELVIVARDGTVLANARIAEA